MVRIRKDRRTRKFPERHNSFYSKNRPHRAADRNGPSLSGKFPLLQLDFPVPKAELENLQAPHPDFLIGWYNTDCR